MTLTQLVTLQGSFCRSVSTGEQLPTTTTTTNPQQVPPAVAAGQSAMPKPQSTAKKIHPPPQHTRASQIRELRGVTGGKGTVFHRDPERFAL